MPKPNVATQSIDAVKKELDQWIAQVVAVFNYLEAHRHKMNFGEAIGVLHQLQAQFTGSDKVYLDDKRLTKLIADQCPDFVTYGQAMGRIEALIKSEGNPEDTKAILRTVKQHFSHIEDIVHQIKYDQSCANPSTGDINFRRSMQILNNQRQKLHEVASEALGALQATLPAKSKAVSQRSKGHRVTDSRKVFVVHGRNNEAREALYTFLRAIGLHPLEWSEIVKATGKASPYIGEVLEKGFEIAQAVIVLMTPDDNARLREQYRGPSEPVHETQLTPQPRPNVLLEAGMALGLFPERTVIVELGRLRPVSDIGGRHIIRMNDTAERRHELAQRLETAGCQVTITGIDWYKAGTFASEAPVATNLIEPTHRKSHDNVPAFLYITSRAHKPERLESGHRLPWICPDDTKEGDTIWVFVRGEGICYKWQAVSKPYDMGPLGVNADVVFLGKFNPPIALEEIQAAVSEEQWGAPYKDFFGFLSVRIPVAAVAKILSLRK